MVVTATHNNFNPNWGSKSQAAYKAAYNSAFKNGQKVGTSDGTRDGTKDCNNWQADEPDFSKYHRSTTATAAQILGRVDGYNDGINDTYKYSLRVNAYQGAPNFY